MRITQAQLEKAVKLNILSQEQLLKISEYCKKDSKNASYNRLINLLYFFGGCIAIGAMFFFLEATLPLFNHWQFVSIIFLYMLAGLAIAHIFYKLEMDTPASLVFIFVILITPIAVYSLFSTLGYWELPQKYNNNYYMLKSYHSHELELATLIMAGVLFYFYRYPFILMPICLVLFIFTIDNGYSEKLYGALMMSLGITIDIYHKKKIDFAFWLYFFGVGAFWLSIYSEHFSNEYIWFGFLLMNIIFILGGVVFSRTLFLIYGTIGFVGYVTHLGFDVFAKSVGFPFILSLIGLGLIIIGVIVKKNKNHRQ